MAVLEAVAFSLLAVRVRPRAVTPAPRLACSTMPCSEALMALVAAEAAVFKGEAGFRGDVGRAMYEWGLAGEVHSLIGERGSVREL